MAIRAQDIATLRKVIETAAKNRLDMRLTNYIGKVRPPLPAGVDMTRLCHSETVGERGEILIEAWLPPGDPRTAAQVDPVDKSARTVRQAFWRIVIRIANAMLRAAGAR
jgi:hypothetical protein